MCVFEGVPDSTKGLFVVLRDYESRRSVSVGPLCVELSVFVMISWELR